MGFGVRKRGLRVGGKGDGGRGKKGEVWLIGGCFHTLFQGCAVFGLAMEEGFRGSASFCCSRLR